MTSQATPSDIATTTPGQLLEERIATPADAGSPGAVEAAGEVARCCLLRVPLTDPASAHRDGLHVPTAPLADDSDSAFDPGAFAGPERFAREPAATRLWLPNTVNVEATWPGLVAARAAPVAAVALDFPAYADGRAYSQARVLRRLGFKGELRATGAAVTSDQVHFMHRCGFDALELRADQDVAACLAALQQFPDPYQTSADGAVPTRVRRRG